MKVFISILVATLFLATACKHKEKPVQPVPGGFVDTDTAVGSYMPVADFIKADMANAESIGGGILRRRTVKGKKDSAYIQAPEFNKLAKQFLLAELDTAAFRENFKESSLMDESTRLLNFIYTPKTKESSLHQVIVYVKPGTTKDEVNRIYMERSFSSGDTVVEQKLNWKLKSYFYILSIRQPKGKPAVTSMDKVIWDPEYFSEE